jgi:hypothetical protein
MKDLLVINTYLEDDRILDIVQRGISYVEEWGIVFDMVPEDRRAVTILDVLVLMMAQSNEDLTAEVREYMSLFAENDIPLSVDVVSFGPTLASSVRDDYEQLQKEYFPEASGERVTDNT